MQYKYILLITQITIVPVNLLLDKININKESQKTLSPSNIRQASRKPTSYQQDTNTNLNNFSPKVNYNINEF
jgi:hypothetical protein